MHPGLIFTGLWVAWAVSWVVASRWSSRPVRTEDNREALTYRLFLLVGGLILAAPAHAGWAVRLWGPGWDGAWLCVALALAGFAFCWWARLHLGQLWSASVTIKPDHHIVDTGPYGLVRHPIYTGLLLAILATVLIKGTLLGIIGAAIIFVGILLKARLEENFLRADLGAQAYEAYAGRVAMLVPFMKFG